MFAAPAGIAGHCVLYYGGCRGIPCREPVGHRIHGQRKLGLVRQALEKEPCSCRCEESPE